MTRSLVHFIQQNDRTRSLLIVIALVLLALPALHPFMQGLAQGQMLRTDDGILHLYRSIALDYSLVHDNTIYPRFASGLVYGYGAELFNYFPPTSYYPAALMGSPQTGYVQAWLLSMMGWLLLATGGAFCLGRFWADDSGGFITAAAYLYAPYLLFDAVTRGTSSELAGLALLPWALWGFSRLAWYGQRRDVLAAVLSFALLIPMHNIITLHGTALLGLYCLFLAWRAPTPRRAFFQMLGAGLLALLLTAFFWWPALAETDHTKISGVVENLTSIDVTQSLRGLGDVFALPHTADPTQLRAPVPITLGWPQMLLAIAGVCLAWTDSQRNRDIRWLQVFLLLMTALVVFLQLTLSASVWETLPLIGFTQFAWRTMGLPSLTLALLAGIGAAQILKRLNALPLARLSYLSYGSALLLVIAYSLPWLYTSYIDIDATDITDAQDYEARRGELTLSSYSEYLPFWNQAPLEPDTLRLYFQQQITVPRLADDTLNNDDVTIQSATYSGTEARLRLNASTETQIIFNWLYTPGWSATLENRPADILSVQPTTPEGRVRVTVPPGQHTLHVSYTGTTLQHRAEWLSQFALLIFAVTLIVWRNPAQRQPESPGTLTQLSQLSGTQIIAIVAAIGLSVFAMKALFLDTAQTVIKRERFAEGVSAGVQIPLQARFENHMMLMGAAVAGSVTSGDALALDTFWTVQQPVERNYSALYRLVDANGHVISETRRYQPGDIASENWQPGYYVADSVWLDVPDYTPPGAYTLQAALYEAESGDLLSRINSAGNPAGVYLDVRNVQVTRPDAQPAPDISGSTAQLDTLPLNILRVDGLPDSAQVGDEISLHVLWQITDTLSDDYQFMLVWIPQQNDSDQATSDTVPLVTGYPLDAWQSGDVWRGIHALYVPGTLSGGVYDVALQLIDTSGESIAAAHVIGTMDVRTPERVYTLPESAQSLDTPWQNGLTLRGYDVTANSVRFYWTTAQPLRQNLRYFVHVLASNNETILAQSDGIPGNWQRPVTGWDTGEIVVTWHTFDDLPGGTYPLRVGWYQPQTGQRVPLSSGGDALDLPVMLRVN